MEHIFRIWPTLAELASDLGKPYPTVASWWRRGRIPPEAFDDVIEAAGKRGRVLTLEELHRAWRNASKAAA